MVTLAEITDQFKERAANKASFGGSAKLVLEGEGAIYVDARGDTIVVSNEDKEADVTMGLSLDTLERMGSGELDGVSAFMQGLITIEGDQTIAMKLGDILVD